MGVGGIDVLWERPWFFGLILGCFRKTRGSGLSCMSFGVFLGGCLWLRWGRDYLLGRRFFTLACLNAPDAIRGHGLVTHLS